MKKIYFFLLLVGGLSSQSYSQDQNRAADNDLFSAARAPYCTPCAKRHYGACTPPSTPTPVPFDGGLSVLLVAGAAYGIKRMRGKKSDVV